MWLKKLTNFFDKSSSGFRLLRINSNDNFNSPGKVDFENILILYPSFNIRWQKAKTVNTIPFILTLNVNKLSWAEPHSSLLSSLSSYNPNGLELNFQVSTMCCGWVGGWVGLKNSKIIFGHFSCRFRQFWPTLIFLSFDNFFLGTIFFIFLGGGQKIICDQFSRHFRKCWQFLSFLTNFCWYTIFFNEGGGLKNF